jgi:hypothetical protein
MKGRVMDPVIRGTALTGAAAHLVYGGIDVLLAGTAFCLVWRTGIAIISDEGTGMDMEDHDRDAAHRLARISRRARSEPRTARDLEDRTADAAASAGVGEREETRPGGPTDADHGPGAKSRIPWVTNLCAEVPFEPRSIDPRACADAMLAFHAPASRTLSAFRRARAEASYGEAWAAEVHAGESMLDTMARVIAQGMPRPEAVAVVCGPDFDQMRAEFDALPSDERADEIQRHLWAMGDPTRVRTRFSFLLSALGIG